MLTLCRISMLPHYFLCVALWAITEWRSHMQRQWLHWKSKPITLSASIKIQKSIERNTHTHTRTNARVLAVRVCSYNSARIKVCATSTVNRLLRQWFHWTRGHVRACFLRSDFFYPFKFMFSFFFLLSFSIKYFFPTMDSLHWYSIVNT